MRTCSSKQKNSRTTVTKPVFLSPTLSKLNTSSIGLNFEFGILVFFLKYFCKLCAQGKLLTFSNRNTIFYSFMCKMSSKLTVWQVEASCAKCLQSWQFDKLKPHVQNVFKVDSLTSRRVSPTVPTATLLHTENTFIFWFIDNFENLIVEKSFERNCS